MLLPLKKEYVLNFDEWIKFSPTFEDIKFPFKKISKFKDNKRNQFFKKIKDNYNMFPYFKKYCDKVFFYLDNEN